MPTFAVERASIRIRLPERGGLARLFHNMPPLQVRAPGVAVVFAGGPKWVWLVAWGGRVVVVADGVKGK